MIDAAPTAISGASRTRHDFVALSTTTQVALLIYLEVVEWIDLFPWNDVRRGNGQGALDVVLGVLMLLAIVGTARRWRALMIGGAAVYTIWLILQLTTFWQAYLFGASVQWQRVYAANFAQTTQWLPRWGTHLPPDANHFMLEILLAAALVSTAVAARRARRAAPRG